MNEFRPSAEIDHIVYAVPELIRGIEQVEDLLHVRAEMGGRHPQWGTRNALVSMGGRCYLEIVGPDPERDRPEMPSIFGLDRLSHPKLATWAARVDSIEDSVVAGRKLGLELGEVSGGFRQRPDGGIVRWRVSDPLEPREGGVVPFLIAWLGSTHPGETSPPGCTLVGLSATHPRGEGLTFALESMGIGLEVREGPSIGLRARIETPQGIAELS